MSFFNIPWEWPSTRIRKSRLKLFTKSLSNSEFVETLTPNPTLTRPRGRPRFRMIDAILKDLDDFNILEFEPNCYEELVKNFGLDKKNRAMNVMYLCNLYKKEIVELE